MGCFAWMNPLMGLRQHFMFQEFFFALRTSCSVFSIHNWHWIIIKKPSSYDFKWPIHHNHTGLTPSWSGVNTEPAGERPPGSSHGPVWEPSRCFRRSVQDLSSGEENPCSPCRRDPLHCWLLRVGFSPLWNTAPQIITYTHSALTGKLSQFVNSSVAFILTFIVPQTCLWCLWSCS